MKGNFEIVGFTNNYVFFNLSVDSFCVLLCFLRQSGRMAADSAVVLSRL